MAWNQEKTDEYETVFLACLGRGCFAVDWNGNGRYDPVDVGIEIARESMEQGRADEEIRGNRGGGCLTSMLLLLVVFPLILLRTLGS